MLSILDKTMGNGHSNNYSKDYSTTTHNNTGGTQYYYGSKQTG